MYEYFLHVSALNCVIVLIATGTQLEMHVAAVLRPGRVLVMARKHISKPKELIKAVDSVAQHQYKEYPQLMGPSTGGSHEQMIDTIRGKARNRIQQYWNGGRKQMR